MSKGVYGVRNPKTDTLTPALVQWLADCQIEELQPIPLRSTVLPRLQLHSVEDHPVPAVEVRAVAVRVAASHLHALG